MVGLRADFNDDSNAHNGSSDHWGKEILGKFVFQGDKFSDLQLSKLLNKNPSLKANVSCCDGKSIYHREIKSIFSYLCQYQRYDHLESVMHKIIRDKIDGRDAETKKLCEIAIYYRALYADCPDAQALSILLKNPHIDLNKTWEEERWKNETGPSETFLMKAVRVKNTDCLRILLNDPRTDVNAMNAENETALMHSIYDRNKEAFDLLINHPDIDTVIYNKRGFNAKNIAATIENKAPYFAKKLKGKKPRRRFCIEYSKNKKRPS